MIGQEKLLKRLCTLFQENKFPHFIILEGIKGSGKRTLVNELSNSIKLNFVHVPDISVDSVRSTINDAYTYKGNCYVFYDVDGMSLAARNALLKVTEEPPNNSYFIMTIEDINNTLSTIKSRATVFSLENYLKKELSEYLKILKTDLPTDMKKDVLDLCETPGEINELVSSGVEDFINYVELVMDNITKVSGANAFKVPSKVALKESENGYDLKLFWKILCNKCINRAVKGITAQDNNTRIYLNWIVITSSYSRQLRIKGINKGMLMDNWILDIREASNGSE